MNNIVRDDADSLQYYFKVGKYNVKKKPPQGSTLYVPVDTRKRREHAKDGHNSQEVDGCWCPGMPYGVADSRSAGFLCC